jgi:hypothetical protein
MAGVALVGLLAFTPWLGHYLEERAWREVCAEADRLDPSWRWEDLLAARPNPPDDRNAGRRADAARRLMPQPWPSEVVRRVLSPGDDVPPAQRLPARQVAHVRRILADVAADALALTYGLEDMSGGRFLSDPNPLQPYLFDSSGVAQLLSLSALLQVEDRQPDAALDTCRRMLAVARAEGDGMRFNAGRMCLVIRLLVVARLEQVLAQGEPGEAALAVLQRSLEAEVARPVMVEAFRGERAVLAIIMRKLREGQMSQAELDLLAPTNVTGLPKIDRWLDHVRATSRWKSNVIRSIRYLTAVIEVEKSNPGAWGERGVELTQVRDRLAPPGDFVPYHERHFEEEYRSRARLRGAIVAVAAERFRRQRGRWPQALDELVPDFLTAVPLDPFNGKPMRLGPLSEGLVIYSVGSDLIDDGGLVQQAPLGQGKDIGVRLWNPEHRRQPPPKPAVRPH